VNEIARTADAVVIAAPTSEDEPVMKLRTPLGMPASANASARRNPLSGASEEGLNTTVLPVTSAGAIFRAGIDTGKFHGVITDTTPSGSRRV